MYIPKILVVDDYPQNLLAMESLLEGCGAEIHTAESGDDALALVLENSYALILLDVHMPRLDGFETAEIIRMNQRTRTIPIIFVTAVSKHRQEEFRGYDSGAVDYILKPLEPKILLSKVAFFLSIDRQKKEVESQSLLLKTIFNVMPSMLFLVNEQGEIEQRNRQEKRGPEDGSRELSDSLAAEITENLKQKKSCPICDKIRTTFEQGKGYSEEVLSLPLPHPTEGTYCCFRLSTSLLQSEGNDKVLLSLSDITDIKKQEDILNRQQRSILLNNRIANTFLTAPREEIFHHTINAILDPLESRFGYFGHLDDEKKMAPPSPENTLLNGTRITPEESIRFAAPVQELSRQMRQSLLPITDTAGAPPLETLLAVPIIHGNNLLGLFAVADKPDGYDVYDRELLVQAANQTAPILYALLEEERHKKKHEQLEQQYLQAQKLESVGRLAGGVAHDLNNLLSPILGYGDLLLKDIGPGDPRRVHAENIISAAHRATDLINQLLAFSRKQDLAFTPLQLNTLINDFKHLLQRTVRENIQFNFILADDLPPVRGDRGQLEQVLMNLSVNAQDAMPDGGTLTFESALMTIDDHDQLRPENAPPGKYVVLTVTDTGSGMDSETSKNIFEPFYTTKPTDKGTGLGLSTVYGIIKQHAGNIQVSSTPGRGTSFQILLPAADAEGPVEPPSEPHEDETKLQGGSETILLVEDNPHVNELAKTILTRNGYRVLSAANGEEALAVLEEHFGPIHLLLTDVIMPDMNGKQLHQKVVEKLPRIKTVFMSGYTDEVISAHGVTQTGDTFIQKPFKSKELIGIIRKMLDELHPMDDEDTVNK